MSNSVIDLDDFKNARFDKTCVQSMLIISSLFVYFYFYYILK